jgi:hypothetical protein
MKRTWVAVSAVALGLWIGYYLGYRHGTQQERTAWQNSEEVDVSTEDGKLVVLYANSASTPTGRVKRVQPAKRPNGGIYYANPHVGREVRVAFRPQVNVPDPRNTPVK